MEEILPAQEKENYNFIFMLNPKDKLIISVANEPFNKIIELVKDYKKIELRLNQLSLTNEEILEVIDNSKLVVITDIAELNDVNNFHKINFRSDQLEKIFIDCPIDKIENEKLIQYIKKNTIKKILSYHQWAPIKNTTDMYLHLMKKIMDKTKIGKFSIIKIAVLIENSSELKILFSLFNEYPDSNFILIPLGEKFQKARIKSLELGSKYMFCYVNQPITSCQLHYEDY